MSSQPQPALLFLLSAFLCPLLAAGPAAWALPSRGQVAGGAATIEHATSKTTITQQSDRALLNWQGFSIGKQETVQFLQPSATSLAVNRVLGGDPSVILGNLFANGRVFLLNPNGVVFGPGSVVNVGGLLASTLGLQSYDLNKGQFSFAQDPTKALAVIINRGTIAAADHGFVVLTAPGVVNDGLIVAKFGHVGLGAGTQMAVDFRGDGLIQYAVSGVVRETLRDVEGRTLEAAVGNSGHIEADGGTVLLTAQASSAVLSSVINQTGVIQARRLEQQGGEIVLRGGDEGVVMVAGALDARGEKSEKGETGGRITIRGDKIALAETAWLDVSGETGGGTITVGGEFQGRGGGENAQAVSVRSGAILTADATGTGDGGLIVIWADGLTRYAGHSSARGGPKGGAGGLIEVSGKETLEYLGTVDLLAPRGTAGTLLLDPKFGVVQAGGGAAVLTNDDFSENAAGTSTMSGTNLATAINSANVILRANTDWTFDDNVTALTLGRSLTVQAGRSIIFNANRVLTLNNGAFTATINDNAAQTANRDAGAAAFSMALGSAINTNGGAVSITHGSKDATVAGSVLLSGTINAGTGAITITGTGYPNASGQAYEGIRVSSVATVVSTSGLTTLTGTGGSIAGVGQKGLEINGTVGGPSTTGPIILRAGTIAGGLDSVSLAGGSVQGTGSLTLEPTTQAGADAFNLSASDVGGLQDGFSSITIGRIDGTGQLTVAGVTFFDPVTLRGLGGGGGLLSVGPITGMDNASITLVSAPVTLTGNLTTSNQAIALHANTTLSGGTRTLDAGTGTVTISGTVTGGGNGLVLRGNGIDLNGGIGSVTGTSSITFEPSSQGTSIGVAGGAGTLQLSLIDLSALADGNGGITIGRFDGIGQLTVNLFTFSDPVTFRGAAGGAIAVNGPITGTDNASITFMGSPVMLGGDLTTSNQPITLQSATTLSGGPRIVDAGTSTVTVDSTLAAGSFPLILRGDGIDLIGGANSVSGTALPGIRLEPGAATTSIGVAGGVGTLQLTTTDLNALADGFNLITIGRQADGQHAIDIRAVTFRDPVAIRTPSGGSIAVNGTITGTGNASVTLHGAGATTILNADIVTPGQPIIIQDSVIVAGGDGTIRTLDTTDANAVTAGANVTVTGTITAETIGGNNESLTLKAGTAGDVDLQSAIGSGQPLNSLTLANARDVLLPQTTVSNALTQTTGTGTTTLNGTLTANVIDLKGQTLSYNGAVVEVGANNVVTMKFAQMVFLADVTVAATDMVLDGPVVVMGGARALDVGLGSLTVKSALNAQGFDLTLRGNSLHLQGGAGSVTGDGAHVLELAPGSTSASIGIAGGEGTLQLSTTVLEAVGTGANGFGTVKLGRADSTGTVTVGSYTSPWPLTIQANAPESDGTIYLAGALATSTPGDSLTLLASKSIALTPGASLMTNNGPLTMTANATGTATGPFVGIDVNGAMVSSGNGALSLTGTGGTSGADNYGVQLRGAAQLQTTAGAIQLDGTGGTGGTNRNVGAHLEGGSLVSSTSGLITITGHGGNGGGLFNRGVDLLGPGTMVTSTTGPIAIQGTGGANASFSYGVAMAQGQVRSGGNISLTGQGGAGGPGTVASLGMLITNGSQVEGLGSASVTLTGTGGAGTATSATNGEVGVFMHGQNGTFIRTANGDVAINGTGNGTGIGGQGVILRAGALVEATGSGNVLVHGIGSTTGSANSNGIQMIEAGTTVRANAGNLTLMGTAHGALNSTNNIGTAIASGALVQKTGPGGTVSITGTGGDGGGGSNNFGVALLSAPTQILANDGAITITGTGTNGAAGVTAQGGFVVGAPGIPCGSCAPTANINAGASGTISINSTP